MSSVILSLSNRMVAAHHFKIMPDKDDSSIVRTSGDREVFNLDCAGKGNISEKILQKKNPFYSAHDPGTHVDKIISAMERFMKYKNSQQSNVVVKIDSICLVMCKELAKYIKRRIAPRLVVIYRRNMLDSTVCYVRDFYGKCSNQNGYLKHISPGHDSVDAITGESSTLCFDRRRGGWKNGQDNSSSSSTKAKFRIDTFPQIIKYFAKSSPALVKQATQINSAVPHKPVISIAAEDLMAFEYQPEHLVLAKGSPSSSSSSLQEKSEKDRNFRMEISVRAWMRMLQQWGIQPDDVTVREVLKQSAPSSKILYPHSHTIYNAVEVQEEMRKMNLTSMFRAD
jgi:hypothetical protein